MSTHELLTATIEWRRDKSQKDIFHAYFGGETLKLRVNSFPDEPCCTLILGDKEYDLEDAGENWKVPWWKKGEQHSDDN